MSRICGMRALSAVGMLVVATGTAFAQTDINWLTATDGDWSDVANWSGDNFPSGAGTNAIIAATGSLYTVTLDLNISLNGFELSWGGATLDLTNNALFTSSSFLLQGGTVTSSTSGASLSLAGSTTIDSGTLSNIDIVSISGSSSFIDATIENIGSLSINNGSSLDIGGETSLSNSILSTSGGTIIFSSDDDTDVTGTDVDSLNGGQIMINGSGNINLTGGSGFHIDSTSSMTIAEGSGQTISGQFDGEKITNEGKFVKGGPGKNPQAGADIVFIEGLEFINTGTVRVEQGELAFGIDTGVTVDDDGVGLLHRGTWEVVNDSTLTIQGPSIFDIGQGAHVLIDGADSSFDALDTLETIRQDASLTISGGKDFTVGNGLSVNGLLAVGEGSTFDTTSGLFNQDGQTLFGGTFEIGGTLLTPDGEPITELSGASVTLIGQESSFEAINGLQEISEDGLFAVMGGREFTTVGDLVVRHGEGEESTVLVGEGSTLIVNGLLSNFDLNGDFTDGIFDIAGTLQANNALVKTIFNDVTLDGVASNILDGAGGDAFSHLERIAETGILRLLNGRMLDVEDLIVDGTLIIDPGPGGEGTRGPDAALTTTGDLTISPAAVIEFVLSDPDQMTGILIGGVMDFGPTDEAGTLVLSLGDGYTAAVGDSFVLIEGEMLGQFAVVDGLDLGGGLSLDLVYAPTGLLVTIVPAPASIGLLALGGFMATRRRR